MLGMVYKCCEEVLWERKSEGKIDEDDVYKL